MTDFKEFVGIDDAVDNTVLTSSLDAAHSWIDAYCGRSFEWIGEETRTFAASSRSTVLIDDAITVTSVTVDGSALSADDWQAEPARAGWPVTRLVAIDNEWPAGRRRCVGVTAEWGWGDVPASIHTATLLMAARLFKRKDAWAGIAGVGDSGPIRLARMDADVAGLLRPYKRPGIV